MTPEVSFMQFSRIIKEVTDDLLPLEQKSAYA